MSELPTNWTRTPLEALGQWGSGGTPKRTNPEYYDGGKIPWLIIGDLNDDVVTHSATHITEVGLANSSAKLLPAETLLIAMYGSIGKLGITGFECATNQAIAFCKPDNNVTTLRYLFYALMNAKSGLIAQGQGGAQQNISQGILKAHEVPLAPLSEQKRIADKLDAVLARVDACRERLDRIPAILKRFRQSVLAAATSGYLTEGFRNGENYSPRQVHFSELVQDSLVGLVRSSVDQFDTGNNLTPYLKMNNISEVWGVNLMNVVQVQCSPQEAERYALKVGDWLFNTRNSTELVGKSCVWKGSHFVFNNNILRVRFNDLVVPDFIEIWFRSPTGRRNLNLVKSATTSVAAIYQRSLMAQMIEIPTVDEQTEIVRRVEALFACADRLEACHAAARAQVEKLTPATLAKAFRGELVPQDPNDEPASALLQRIRPQRSEPAGASSKRIRKVAA